jgi:hypothetical protein
MNSVLHDWVCGLTLMQQSVLLAMVRNADGIEKHHPQKELIKWFRRCILKSAFDNRELTTPDEPGGGSFTGPVADINNALDQFIWARDGMTLHYYAHAMHAFQIIGYHHPNAGIRGFWNTAYTRMVHALHLLPEPVEMMDRRLCDNEDKWRERCDEAGGCTDTQPTTDKTMIDRALGHASDPDYFKARYNIPDGVYYFDGNFYDATTKAGMGIEFYNAWHFRAREFPGRPLEHIKIRAEIGRRDDR